MNVLRRHLDGGRFAKRLGIAAAALALFLLFSELLMTLFNTKQVRNDVEYYISRVFTRDEWSIATKIRDILLQVGHRPYCVPDTIVYLYKPMKSDYLTINSDGIRGPEITPKQPGEYRIAITGASLSYGLYFPEEATVPAVVQRRLREQCPECRITTYNLGIESYDLQRDIALVKRLLDKIRPDLVLFYDGAADIGSVYVSGYQRHEPFKNDGPYNDAQVKAMQPFYKKRMIDYTRVGLLVANSVRNEKGLLPDPTPVADAFSRDLPPALEIKSRALAEGFVNDMIFTATELREKGIDSLFVFMTNAVFKEPRAPLEDSTLKILETLMPGFGSFSIAVRRSIFAEAAADRFDGLYDFSDIFDGIPDAAFFDVIHMSPLGNRLLAEKMTELLVKKGVLEKAKKALSTGSGQAATPSPSTPDRSPSP